MNDSKNETNCQSTITFAVYVIWCMPTKKFYVGVTRQKNVYTRIRQHKRGKQFVDIELQKAGWENCDWWAVQENVPANLISDCEQRWVAFFDCVYPKGYNKTCGGISKIIVTDETRAKISKAALERDMSGENHPMYGKHHTDEARAKISEAHKVENLSDETRAKLSAAQKGKKASPETKAKLSASRTGEKNHFYGKHHTEESNEKNRQAHLGKHPSDEARAKMSESHKRENLSDETISKMSASHAGEKNGFYGKTHTEETRALLSAKLSGENHPMYGKHLSEETRAKLSETHKRENLSPETRAKMSASAKARCARQKAAKLAAENSTENSAQDKTS